MNRLLSCGAILGLVSVIMGAIGDHALIIPAEKAESFETAIRYNMLYASLIVALATTGAGRKLYIPGFIFALGTILFSFSIYLSIITRVEWATYMTPAGGLMIMGGWITLIFTACKYPIPAGDKDTPAPNSTLEVSESQKHPKH